MEALKTVWNFIQDEVLGMNWLDRLLATILNAVGLDTTGKIGSSIHFFIDNKHHCKRDTYLYQNNKHTCKFYNHIC